MPLFVLRPVSVLQVRSCYSFCAWTDDVGDIDLFGFVVRTTLLFLSLGGKMDGLFPRPQNSKPKSSLYPQYQLTFATRRLLTHVMIHYVELAVGRDGSPNLI